MLPESREAPSRPVGSEGIMRSGGTGKGNTTMLHDEGIRRMGPVGAWLAFVSPIPVRTVATPAVAIEVGPASLGGGPAEVAP